MEEASRHLSVAPLRRLVTLLALLALLATGCAMGDASGDTGAPPPEAETSTDETRSDDDGADRDDGDEERPAGVESSFERVDGASTTARYEATEGAELWAEIVPSIEEVRIPSSADDGEQPAMWLPPQGTDDPVPLLVVLHSFSYGYAQHAGIPFAQWAEEHGWAMIHPHFGGPFGNPRSAGSDESVQDVLDAVEFALEEGGVDEDRIYLLGFSGGGMMGLLVGGQHTDRFAGIVSWVPVLDLVDWYAYNLTGDGEPLYAYDVETACGGDLRTDDAARAECLARSPLEEIDALAGSDTPVYLGHGADDDVVPPTHAIEAYEALTGEEISDDVRDLLDDVAGTEALGDDDRAVAFFDDLDPDVVHVERSGDTVLVLFRGSHDMVFHPGLRWIYELAGGVAQP
jgi:predicted esterase